MMTAPSPSADEDAVIQEDSESREEFPVSRPITPKPIITPAQQLEAALKECGFGRFQVRLILTVLVSNVANVLVSVNTSYLLPNAECDLGMSINQKGLLNAMPYIGMLTSGLFTGFLTDAFGRKRFLLWGYFGMFCCSIVAGSSQKFESLLVAKYFEGFIFNAALIAMLAIVAELSYYNIRDRMMLCCSCCKAVAQIIISLFSWAILPRPWRFSFGNDAFVLNSWNIYLYASSLWSIAACILYTYLPESPNFLVAHEKYNEALHILRDIYLENKRKPLATFSIRTIGTSHTISSNSLPRLKSYTFSTKISHGMMDSRIMFYKPLVLYLILISIIQVFTTLTYDVMRLWYPQLSTIIEHYVSEREYDKKQTLCNMLDSWMAVTTRSNVSATRECIPHPSGNQTYINGVVMGCVTVIPYVVSGVLVNRVGKKLLMIVLLVICCACMSALSWTVSSYQVVGIVSSHVALSQTCVGLLQTIVIDIFPTVTKSLALSIIMMGGRVGSLVGNILFPVLLERGCMVPFLTIAVILTCVILLSMLLPSAQKE